MCQTEERLSTPLRNLQSEELREKDENTASG